MSPEHRLWIAAVNQTMMDLDLLLARLKVADRKIATPEQARRVYRDLEQFWHEVESEWFLEICSFIGCHPDRVYRAIRRRFKKRGLVHLLKGYQ